MEIQQLHRHICITSSAEIREISQPIFKHFHLNNFRFCRHYNGDRKRIFFLDASIPAITLYLQNIDKTNSFKAMPIYNHVKYLSFKQAVSTISNKQAKEKYEHQITEQHRLGIDEELTILKKYEKFTDVFEFETDITDPQGLTRLISNLDLLYHFIDYFYNKTTHLLSLSDKHSICFEKDDIFSDDDPSVSQLNAKQFFAETAIKKFFVVDIFGEIKTLTRKEMECAIHVKTGLTGERIAEKMCLSRRTVEMHTNTIKEKLLCENKSALIRLLNKHSEIL